MAIYSGLLYISVFVWVLIDKGFGKNGPEGKPDGPLMRIAIAAILVPIFGCIFWALAPVLSFLSKLMLLPYKSLF